VAAAVARFDRFTGNLAPLGDGPRATHGWIGGGVRAVLFP
jgi:hypothetical protein